MSDNITPYRVISRLKFIPTDAAKCPSEIIDNRASDVYYFDMFTSDIIIACSDIIDDDQVYKDVTNVDFTMNLATHFIIITGIVCAATIDSATHRFNSIIRVMLDAAGLYSDTCNFTLAESVSSSVMLTGEMTYDNDEDELMRRQ